MKRHYLRMLFLIVHENHRLKSFNPTAIFFIPKTISAVLHIVVSECEGPNQFLNNLGAERKVAMCRLIYFYDWQEIDVGIHCKESFGGFCCM